MAQYTNTNNTLTRGIVRKMPPTFIESSAYYYSLFCLNKEEANNGITNYMAIPQSLSARTEEQSSSSFYPFLPHSILKYKILWHLYTSTKLYGVKEH